MLDITVVILTFNESKHIERCIRSLEGVVKRVVIIDSFSTDNTVDLCKLLGAEVYKRKWVNYSDQFQWALDNCDITTCWTMRMDADEYLESSLIEETIIKLPNLSIDVNAIYLKRKIIFSGKWIRYGGTYPLLVLRIWKTGSGRIEKRWMDEHIVLDHPNHVQFDGDLVDENLNNISWWTDKHNSYATREMIDLLNIKYSFIEKDETLTESNNSQARFKRQLKEVFYARLPLSFRSAIYFLYRYVIRLGFIDGKAGFMFHFLQGFWYRYLVDVKVSEIERLLETGSAGKDVKSIIETVYDVKL
jgi:glycosyltransferase involved in cell wall biosynthesis